MYKTVSHLDTEGRNEWSLVSCFNKGLCVRVAWPLGFASARGEGIPSRLKALYRRRVLSREAVAMTRLRAIGVGNRIKP